MFWDFFKHNLIEFLTKALEMLLFCCLKTWMTWAEVKRRKINENDRKVGVASLLMIESKVSSSSGVYFGFESSGMHDLLKISSPNTSPARRTLYKAGLSQKILKMSSFLTWIRLPLCNATTSPFWTSAFCWDFPVRTVRIMNCFFWPTEITWYSARRIESLLESLIKFWSKSWQKKNSNLI